MGNFNSESARCGFQVLYGIDSCEMQLLSSKSYLIFFTRLGLAGITDAVAVFDFLLVHLQEAGGQFHIIFPFLKAGRLTNRQYRVSCYLSLFSDYLLQIWMPISNVIDLINHTCNACFVWQIAAKRSAVLEVKLVFLFPSQEADRVTDRSCFPRSRIYFSFLYLLRTCWNYGRSCSF